MHTMTRNALHREYWCPNAMDMPTRSVVAAGGYERLKSTPNIGKRGRAEVIAWLAEEGLQFADAPDEAARLKRRLDAAAALLRKHGFKVRKAPNVGIERRAPLARPLE